LENQNSIKKNSRIKKNILKIKYAKKWISEMYFRKKSKHILEKEF